MAKLFVSHNNCFLIQWEGFSREITYVSCLGCELQSNSEPICFLKHAKLMILEVSRKKHTEISCPHESGKHHEVLIF
jgi:hypothetical protein